MSLLKHNVLYITPFFPLEPIKNGGDVVSESNYKLLYSIFRSVSIYSIKYKPNAATKFFKLLFSFFGYYYPALPFCKSHLSSIIERKDISVIYIDGSRYGYFAKLIKQNFPNLRIITFYHNVETKYLLSRDGENFLRKSLLKTVSKSENDSLRLSDVALFITDKDRSALVDGKAFKKAFILPVNLPDKLNGRVDELEAKNHIKSNFILFFGSAFHANIEGLSWFIENVMQSISFDLKVVGRGFENVKFNNLPDNVEIIGSVNDPFEYISAASCVVSPIFSGSGMKVKIAETMMYGKTILASSQSMVGYDAIPNGLFVCNSAEDYIENLKDISMFDKYNEDVRQCFIESYSESGVKIKLAHYLGSMI